MNAENNDKPEDVTPQKPPEDWWLVGVNPDASSDPTPVTVTRTSIRWENNLSHPPDEETMKRIEARMKEVMQKALEGMMIPINRMPPDPQYVVAHIDDMVQIARLYRAAGLFLRRVKGMKMFSVYNSGPGDIHRRMSKFWEHPPRARMVIAVDTERRIERGKMIVLPSPEPPWKNLRESIKFDRDDYRLWDRLPYGIYDRFGSFSGRLIGGRIPPDQPKIVKILEQKAVRYEGSTTVMKHIGEDEQGRRWVFYNKIERRPDGILFESGNYGFKPLDSGEPEGQGEPDES